MSLKKALVERLQRITYELTFVSFLTKEQREVLKKELKKVQKEIEQLRKQDL